jgi:hypothetical protein
VANATASSREPMPQKSSAPRKFFFSMLAKGLQHATVVIVGKMSSCIIEASLNSVTTVIIVKS